MRHKTELTHGDDDHGLGGRSIQARAHDDGEGAELTEIGLRRVRCVRTVNGCDNAMGTHQTGFCTAARFKKLVMQ